MGTVPGLLLLALAASALAPPAPDAPARSYYDCMVKNLAVHAKKTDRADEAIEASKASCNTERMEFIRAMALSSVAAGHSRRDVGAIAKKAVELFDSDYYATYVKTVLDSRSPSGQLKQV